MNPLQDILIYITETLGLLFLILVILRFLLQLARADYYNQYSQAITKITNPLLIPIRRVIPGFFGIDLASVVLALLVQVIVGELIFFIAAQQFFNPLSLIIWGALGILKITTYIGFALILILVVSSFVAPFSHNPALVLVRQLTDPMLRPIRNVIPSAGGLDFSVFFLGMGIVILQKVIDAVAVSIQLYPALVLGI